MLHSWISNFFNIIKSCILNAFCVAESSVTTMHNITMQHKSTYFVQAYIEIVYTAYLAVCSFSQKLSPDAKKTDFTMSTFSWEICYKELEFLKYIKDFYFLLSRILSYIFGLYNTFKFLKNMFWFIFPSIWCYF